MCTTTRMVGIDEGQFFDLNLRGLQYWRIGEGVIVRPGTDYLVAP